MRNWFRVIGLMLLSFGVIPASGYAKDAAMSPMPDAKDALQYSFKSIDAAELALSQYRGKKAVLIVNTASQCGFTPQYAGLEMLYKTYKDKGLVVIGVPSNDFGNQEPGTSEEIKQFTTEKFAVTFPLTQKEIVSGEGAHPFFERVRSDLGIFATPKWNFYKYLISPQGKIVGWWSSKTAPMDPDIVKAVEANLPAVNTAP